MYNVTRQFGALILLASLGVHAGGVKKWVDENGQVHFGDAPPPSVTKTESVKVPHSSSATHNADTPGQAADEGASNVGDDYYSPQNQLRRMEQQRAYEQQLRMQQRSDVQREELLQQYKESHETVQKQQDKIDNAYCERYRARVEEYEHKLMGTYKSEQDRLSDKSHLGTLKVLQARYCK